jgi:hypothetical protein
MTFGVVLHGDFLGPMEKNLTIGRDEKEETEAE